MFVAHLIDEDEHTDISNLYFDFDTYHRDTFCPDII